MLTAVRATAVVAERSEQVVAARLEPADAVVTAGVHATGPDEERNADVVEFAVGKAGADVADVAPALADEDRESALRRDRIARRCRGVAAGERIAEVVEWRASRLDRLLERRERLRDVDRDGLVVGGRRCAEGKAVAICKIGIAAHRRCDALDVAAHFARIDHRPQALRPQTVARAVPAVPALHSRVRDARRVAVHAWRVPSPWPGRR